MRAFESGPMHAREVVCGQHIAAVWGLSMLSEMLQRLDHQVTLGFTGCSVCAPPTTVCLPFKPALKHSGLSFHLSDRTKARVLCTRSIV
jgi:hypothetical protein